jgi:hypothetical protein
MPSYFTNTCLAFFYRIAWNMSKLNAFHAGVVCSPFLNKTLAEFTATYDETMRGDYNGAALLDRVIHAPADSDGNFLAATDMPHVEPPALFFPLSSQSIQR